MIFTNEMMWQAAVKQMGTEDSVGTLIIPLYTPEDVAELYKALQEALEAAKRFSERNPVGCA